MRRRVRTFHVLIVLLLSGFSVAMAGNWHTGESLKCENCHLQHAVVEGQALPGGPFSTLLLKNSINELCLSCHNGSDLTAPDVLAPIQMYDQTVLAQAAGGQFSLIGIDNHAGHSLGFAQVTPLETQASLRDLNCASCHAVHGNENYRNLAYDPGGHGDSIVVREGTDVLTEVRPDNPPTIAGSIAAYSRDNVAYKQNYSAWCSSCHNELATNTPAAAPAHFNGHPSGVALNEYGAESHADALHWVTGIDEGFELPRLPFESPLAAGFVEATQPAQSDVVFCGSCHAAHGGVNTNALRWPYKDGGANFISGCQQCHNK